MKMPSMADALAGKWPKDWEWAGNKNYEEMPIGRVFADAVLLPNGKVCRHWSTWVHKCCTQVLGSTLLGKETLAS
jgi:hypothetical protein